MAASSRSLTGRTHQHQGGSGILCSVHRVDDEGYEYNEQPNAIRVLSRASRNTEHVFRF